MCASIVHSGDGIVKAESQYRAYHFRPRTDQKRVPFQLLKTLTSRLASTNGRVKRISPGIRRDKSFTITGQMLSYLGSMSLTGKLQFSLHWMLLHLPALPPSSNLPTDRMKLVLLVLQLPLR